MAPPRVGIGWSTHFKWRGLTRYPRLRWSYRAPGLVAAGCGNTVDVLGVDEGLVADQLDGTVASRAEDVDVVYLAAHGELRQREHTFVLHGTEWKVTAGGLGARAPSVAVFDACNLVDISDRHWADPWFGGNVGPHLRLVLGFASLATVDRRSADRGEAFVADVNAGVPIAQAWLTAVHTTSTSRRDIGVALAFGDDQADVDDLLLNKRVTDLPLASRSHSGRSYGYRTCH